MTNFIRRCSTRAGISTSLLLVMLVIPGCPLRFYGSIQGTVVTTGGVPLESAIVVLHFPAVTEPAVRFTNNSGTYAFIGLESGIYIVETYAYGYVAQRIEVDLGADEVVNVDFELTALDIQAIKTDN